MNIQEIYNLLFAGKKLELTFPNEIEINAFKVRLHQVKLANEKPSVEVGLMKEEDRQQLNCKVYDENGVWHVQLFLSDKAPKKEYTVTILDE